MSEKQYPSVTISLNDHRHSRNIFVRLRQKLCQHGGVTELSSGRLYHPLTGQVVSNFHIVKCDYCGLEFVAHESLNAEDEHE